MGKLDPVVLFILSFICSGLGTTKKFHFEPGVKGQKIKFFSGHSNTKVLHDFEEEVGTDSVTVQTVAHHGFYSLKVINNNGSFVDDVQIYHAIPSWLCKFQPEEYLVKPLPTAFHENRTAVLACTVLGAPAPTFTWEKYQQNTETWSNIDSLGLLEDGRYHLSKLGHLYIKRFNLFDTGMYRCRASNSCGSRCPDQPECSLEDVIGDPIELLTKEPSKGYEQPEQYFLNPIINHCWDTEGVYYEGPDSRFCSGRSPNAGHIYNFNQYTSLNSSPSMEAFLDFQRDKHDGLDVARVSRVKWNENQEIQNFKIVEDEMGESGVCIAEISGFKKRNMEEYYYCAAYVSSGLLKQGLRFEFVMKEAPYVGLPRGLPGRSMSKVIQAPYGSSQKLLFTIQVSSPGFDKNKVKDQWMCIFNGVEVVNSWHHRCKYNETESDIVEFSIDYTVFGDGGYYQILAANDEGWAIGPPILLVVSGSLPEHGEYLLRHMGRATDRIAVAWNQPNVMDTSSTMNFEVYCTNIDWDEPERKLIVQNKLQVEIMDLEPGVLYAINVWLDGGLVADTRKIRTYPIRTNAQIHFTCVPGATFITCRWDEPDPNTRHSEQLYYQVSISTSLRAGEEETNITTIEGSLTTTLSNLRPYTKYQIRIGACNEMGCSRNQNSTFFQTEQERPGNVMFLKEPLASHFSVHVAMRYPVIMPGILETEVVRYEEHDFRKLEESVRATLKKHRKDQADINAADYFIANDTNGIRHLFDQETFDIAGLVQSTTYYMKFRWKTGAGDGPFTPWYKIEIGRYIDYEKILIGCGVAAGFCIAITGFCIYVNRRWPGLAKAVIAKIRDYIKPSYMQPSDPFEDFQAQEEDKNIVYEFEDPGGEVFYMT